MSTAGKFGERQSWRRAGGGEQSRRRTTKLVITGVALLLLALFLYILLSRDRNTIVRTILIAPPYNADIVTAPLFADSARQAFVDQLDATVLRDDSETVLASFRDTDVVTQYLEDKDDTVMVVLRGFLLLDQDRRPALACSDLGIDKEGKVTGLVPIAKLLEPLAQQAPASFKGIRLVVLDLEPLAGHPTLGQWEDDGLRALGDVVEELEGVCADRVFLLATRGPLQNVGWNSQSQMPYSCETLLEALAGYADLNKDREILLDELCAFISSSYARLPRNADTEAPTPMLLQGGRGWISQNQIAARELEYRVVWTDPVEEPETESDGEAEENETEEDTADAPVIAESEANKPPTTPTVPDSDKGVVGTEKPPEAIDEEGGDFAPMPPIIETRDDGWLADADVWELKDRFEAEDAFNGEAAISPIALGPHLWRQMFVRVLSNEVRAYDQTWSTDVPQLVADDLRKLWALSQGDTERESFSDEFATKLAAMVTSLRAERAARRMDRRVQSLDQLQHAIAVARCRVWCLLEYERHAAPAGIQSPRSRLDAALQSSESLLATTTGIDSPLQADVDRQLAELNTGIGLFDEAVSDHVERLLGDSGFSLADPARTWELSRAAWTLLRSPLPNSQQRARLLEAIRSSPLDEDDKAEREINLSDARLASISLPTQPSQLLAEYRRAQDRFQKASVREPRERWTQLLANPDQTLFADRFSVALRIDPRLEISIPNPIPMVHGGRPLPIIRNPSAKLLDESLSSLPKPASISLETLQDSKRIVLRVHPDREAPTRLLISCELQAQSFGSPLNVRWRIPGLPQAGIGETVRVVVNDDQPRDLPLEIAPIEAATPGERPILLVRVRGETESDQIEGVVGTYRIGVELPQPNRLRVVASAHRKIGCTKETISGDDDIPGGLWLRTFHSRKTPFQLSVFNESGKPCRARIWMVRLPNAMPMDVSAYWPDLAATRYSKPDGGLLDANGRIQEQFLRDERILLGPAELAIPSAQRRVALDFTPPPPEADAPVESPPPPKPFEPVDVSHAIALIARLVNEDGTATREDDQVIVMAAKPWSPRNYVQLSSRFIDGEVEVVAELKENIDGDNRRDEIPQIEVEPLLVRWTEDRNWRGYRGQSESPPEQRAMKLLMQAGGTINDFRVPVSLGRRESWVNIDVDGWPRAIRQRVSHQQNARGEERTLSEVDFSSIALLLDPEESQEEPRTYYSPSSEIYFQGRGEAIRTVLRADFASSVFNRQQKPEIRLQVENRTYKYLTDRSIRTELVGLSKTGVIELLTTVGELTQDLNQGQRANDRIAMTTSLVVGANDVDSKALTAVLDSTKPSDISITADRSNKLFAPTFLQFSVSARDSNRDASGIRRIEFGLDTTGDGKMDTQRGSHTFDPPKPSATVPRSKTKFKLQVAQEYGVIVKAIDACDNELIDDARFTIKTKPKPKPTSDPKNTKPVIVYGRLHGIIDTKVGISGKLTLSPAPKPVTSKQKSIVGQDKSFDFGMLPAGKYTLTFEGAMNNRSVKLVWPGLEVDTTPTKSKPERLKPSEAE